MIDWSQVFEEAHPDPGASEEEIAAFLAELGRPLSPEEIAEVNRWNTNPFRPSDPLHASWRPFDAAAWRMPDRPVPESYLSFLRYSNGGQFRNGDRLFQMYGTGLRQMMLDRLIPRSMPLALPFAFNGGGVMYLFDMRQPAVNGEYPILCASAGCLDFDPHYSPRVADSFLEVCRGRFNVERLRYGGVVLNAQTWETCTDPDTMLDDCRASPRTLRLFAVACCRRVAHLLPDKRFRQAVEVVERYAEGQASDKQRQAAKEACKKARGTPVYTPAAAAATEAVDSSADQAAASAARSAACAEAGNVTEGPAWEAARASQVALLREIFNNPFRTIPVDRAWLDHNGGAVRSLARAIHQERRFEEMPVLADALQEAGCSDEEILEHCRGPNAHVRGCWVLDLILSAE
jgi:hypothetical protein